MSKRPIFFLVSGFGFGNSSRAYALIEEFNKRMNDRKIFVFTWGQGRKFFDAQKEKPFELISLIPYGFPTRFQSYLPNMLISMLAFLLFFLPNSIFLFFYFLKYRPALAIFDSDYHLLQALPFRTIKVFVGQALDVLEKGRMLPSTEKRSFLFSRTLEWVDGNVQKTFFDKVIVPTLDYEKRSEDPKKTLRVPIIVRNQFLQTTEGNPNLGPIALLSGSGIGSKDFRNFCDENKIPILEDEVRVGAELSKHNPLIIQGGLSSVSEGLCLGKHLLILPVEGHWEQHLNAVQVEKLGRGKHLKSIEEIMPHLATDIIYKPWSADGAKQAVDALIQLL